MAIGRKDSTTEVLALIRTMSGRRPLIVAIDGMSAAGKSTLATETAGSLSHAEVVHGDDFYRVMDEDYRLALAPGQGYHEYFDWQRLQQEVLVPIRAGRVARFRRYDWSTAQLGDWAEARPAPVVIVEGVYVSRPELRPIFDLAVWVETPAEMRAARRLERNNSPKWVERWDRAERFYIAEVQPLEAADLVVGGTA